MARNISMFACAGFVKYDDFNRAWPLNNSEEKEQVIMDEEMRKTILKLHSSI